MKEKIEYIREIMASTFIFVAVIVFLINLRSCYKSDMSQRHELEIKKLEEVIPACRKDLK